MNESDLLNKGYVYNQSTRSWEKPEHSSEALATRSQAPLVESFISDEPLAKSQVQKRLKARFNLRFYQFTRRRQDPDNCICKYQIDWLRAKGFIPDDTDDDIVLTVRQIQVKTKEEEGVLIEIL